jgi:biotin carboxyl carrier protein
LFTGVVLRVESPSQSPTAYSMKLQLLHNERPVSLLVQRQGEGWSVTLPDGSAHEIIARRLADGRIHVRTSDRALSVAVAQIGLETHVSHDGKLYVFEPSDVEGGVPPARKATGDLTAPMPGMVVDVLVEVGDHVEAYQPVAVVEAMKVMATVEAALAGRVSEICVQKGQRVAQGEKLVVVAPEEADRD